jgi:hypothetical protein
MLTFRFLALPAALATFATLHVLALKAPVTVGTANVLIWALLPALLMLRASRAIRKKKTRTEVIN